MSFYDSTVPVFINILGALNGLLDKAEAHCKTKNIKEEIMLGMRLYPDMLPLTKQFQLATDFAGKGSAKLPWAHQVVKMGNIGITSNWRSASTSTTPASIRLRPPLRRPLTAWVSIARRPARCCCESLGKCAGATTILPGRYLFSMGNMPGFILRAMPR